MSKKTIRNVASIEGHIWNDDTRTIAMAVNKNAEVLKDLIKRVEKLELSKAEIESQESEEEDGKN